MEKNYKIINEKNNWDEIIDNDYGINEFDVIVLDDYQIHNLMYLFVYLQKKSKTNEKVTINIICKSNIDNNELYYKILTIMYIAYFPFATINVIDEANNERICLNNDSYNFTPNFDKILPILKFDANMLPLLCTINVDLIKYSMSSKSKNKVTYLNTDNSLNIIIKFIKNVLSYFSKDSNIYPVLLTALKDLNLLGSFIFFYFIYANKPKKKGVMIEFDYYSIKTKIRNFSYGLYQIIENSCIHSSGKYSLCYFSFVDATQNKHYKLDTEIAEERYNLNKKLSYLENYYFKLNDEKNIFVVAMDYIEDINKNSIASTLCSKLNQEQMNLSLAIDYLYKGKYGNIISGYGIKTFLESAQNIDASVRIVSGNEAVMFNQGSLQKNKTSFVKKVTEFDVSFSTTKAINSNEVDKPYTTNYGRKLLFTQESFKTFSLDSIFKTNKTSFTFNEKKQFVEDAAKLIIDNIMQLDNNTIFTSTFKIPSFEDNNNILYYSDVYSNIAELFIKTVASVIEKIIELNKKYYHIVFLEMDDSCLYNTFSELLNYCNICFAKIKNSRKKSFDDSNIQIAFYQDNGKEKKYITSMIGFNPNTAIQTFINNFLYEHLDSIISKYDIFIANNYLSKNNNNELQLFPFEFKYDEFVKNNIFMNSAKKYIIDNYTKEDLNIMLASGLYLTKFYDVYNIFQNDYFVKRIAYLIALSINDSNKSNDNILLVGYGAYSHMVCESIKSYLDGSHTIEIYYISDVSNDFSNHNEINCNREFYTIAIVPIGTTFKTFNKLNLGLKKLFLDKKQGFIYNNDYLFDESYNIITVYDKDSNSQYWVENEESNGFINYTTNNKPKIKVKGLIELDTSWSEEGLLKPVSHVDDVSILPNIIFYIQNNDITDDSNDDKLFCLKDSITYGHISDNERHHLFYIDFKNALKKIDPKQIYSDVESKGIKIDFTSYNIIISPLNMDNDLFLKDIIEEVFGNNCTCIQFDLKHTFRENFVQKYKFIKDNIEKFSKYKNFCDVNIYFVDNTIITGKTIKRAKELINSLLPSKKTERVFEKVFIFANRASMNTLNSIMGDEKNVYRYLDINCPCFDTFGGQCPDCRISNNYNKLAYVTLNDNLRAEYRKKEIKHKVMLLDGMNSTNSKNDFVRLYFTHKILSLKEIIANNSDISFIDEKYNEIVKKLRDNNVGLRDEEYLDIFIKVLSRPYITNYEKLKQIFFEYIKNKFENYNFESINDLGITIIKRLAYFGSGYLNSKVNDDNINTSIGISFDEKYKQYLSFAKEWENAYKKGIIK